MGALTFQLKKQLNTPLDCSVMTPDRLSQLSLNEIKHCKLNLRMHAPMLADVFDISGDDAHHIVIRGDCHQLTHIGAGMKKGQITIAGNAGDFVGAGMQGGVIICQGNVGDRVGDSMRRGLILIDGDAGDYAASRMVAGTIGVYGRLGRYAGYGMRRGTLLLNCMPILHPTLQDCGSHTLGFLPLLFSSFSTFETRFNSLRPMPVRRFSGDLGVNGKGEVLVLQVS